MKRGKIMENYKRKYFALASTIATTLLLGIYTQYIEWVPALRGMAHFFGAASVPGYASLITSSLIYDYENKKNKKLQKKIEKDKMKEEGIQEHQKYEVNPKIKNNLLKASMVAGSFAYIAFCGSWESFQFSQTNILELPQYILDVSGPLFGMAAIGTIDGKPLYDKIDQVDAKIIGKLKKTKLYNKIDKVKTRLTEKFKKTKLHEKIDKNKAKTTEKFSEIENNGKNQEKQKKTEKLANWDLRQYGETKEGYRQKVSKVIENINKEDRKDKKIINEKDLGIE